MARVVKYKPLFPWLGGLNTSIDPTILEPQQLVQADNIVFSTTGSRKKRGGQAHYNTAQIGGSSAAENVVFVTDYWATVSSTKKEYFVALTDAGKAYRSPFNGTWSSFSTLTLSVTQGGATATVMNNALILGIKGSGVPKVWAGQSTSANLVNLVATSTSALPFTNAWIVTTFLERLVCAGDPANPDRVYISAAGDYQNWTATTGAGTAITLTVGGGDGDPDGITAVFTGTGSDRILYVAKRKHLYRINCADLNQVNWAIQPISNEIGVVNPNTVAKIDVDDVIFASDRGVHSLGQVIATTAIIDGNFLSFPIQYDYLNVVSQANKNQMSAVYMPSINSYLLGCKRTGQTTFETVYGFNVELKQWFRWTSVPCNFLTKRFNKANGVDELYAGAQSGYVNQLLQTALNDFGNPIVTVIKTAFIAPEGMPFQECQFTGLALFYRSHENSTITVLYSIDGLNQQQAIYNQKIAIGNTLGTTLLGASTFILGSFQSIKPNWNHLSIGEGNALQLTLIQGGLNQDFELFGLALEYTADEEAQNAYRNPLYG